MKFLAIVSKSFFRFGEIQFILYEITTTKVDSYSLHLLSMQSKSTVPDPWQLPVWSVTTQITSTVIPTTKTLKGITFPSNLSSPTTLGSIMTLTTETPRATNAVFDERGNVIFSVVAFRYMLFVFDKTGAPIFTDFNYDIDGSGNF